jgi:hypothetical protein
MGWTFRMVFEGVCAFATDQPLFEQDKDGKWVPGKMPPSELTVLIPDLQRPALAQDSTPSDPHFRAAHFPLLMFEREDFHHDSTRFIDLSLQDPASTVQKGVCVLQGDAIQPDSISGRRLEFDTQTSSKELPEPADRSSVWWLPNLAEIAREAGAFDPKLKPYNGQALDSRLAAALSLKAGRLFSLDYNYADDGDPVPAVWQFSTGRAGFEARWNRAVANRIAFEINDLTAPFGLTFERVADGHAMASRALFAPPLGSRKRVVTVHIANVELEKLFAETNLFPNAGKSLVDADFEAFYDLLSNPKTIRPVPRVRPEHQALGPIKQPCAPSHGTI